MTPDQRISPFAPDIRERLQAHPIVPPPLIVPTSEGFQLDGWKTPVGVTLGTKDKTIDTEKFGAFLTRYCSPSEFKSEGVTVDQDGVLSSIGIKYANQIGHVILTEIDPYSNQGEYQFTNVRNGRVAVILQAMIATYLNLLQPRERPEIPFLDTRMEDPFNYFPRDLTIPRFLTQAQQPLTTIDYQNSFVRKAVAMAQGSNLTINPRDGITYNPKSGLLTDVIVRPGNACFYHLDPGSGLYGEHNVDNSEQAIVLHWVCGTFIRDLGETLSRQK